MRFGVLGTLEVEVAGRPIAVRGTMQRRLLGLLLSQANRVVSTDALIEALWNASPPPSAGKTLQSHIVRLREAVDPARRLLQTRPPGYVLQVEPSTVDALRFEELTGRARRARAAGAPESASAMITDALALWRGPAYADLRECHSLAQEAVGLEELRLGALEERIAADLALGGGAELIPELDASVRMHPYREGTWRQLAVALYRAGRQADALRAIARARAQLREELGLDPGPELQLTEQAILAQDASLMSLAPARPAAPLPPALLADAWPLVGRDPELRRLRSAWQFAARSRGGLLLITGRSGVGRSRLLAEFAREVAACGVAVWYGSGRTAADPLVEALHHNGTLVGSHAHESAVAEALDRSADLPTLIALDDLHLASEVPNGLIAAAAAADELPLLIVASYDPGAAPAALHALAKRLDPVGRRTVELCPLSGRAVDELIDVVVDPAHRGHARQAVATVGGQPAQLRRKIAEAVEAAATQRVNGAAREAEEARRDLGPARVALASGLLDLRAARSQRAGAANAPPEPARCPYKGLARYDAADAEFFAGRERLTAQLVARLVEDDLLVIVGASGSGKSSVARAGLLAALTEGVLPESERWRQVVLVPGADPQVALCRALSRLGERDTPSVILVDQFEEVFTSCADEDRRKTFITDLLALRERQARVVLTLRADYYAACAAYPDLAARLADNSVLVGPLSEEELGRVVALPAQQAGLTIGPGLVEVVLADVAGQGAALPLLSTALLRTWEHREGRVLSTQSYREGGGIASAVERLAESAYGRMDAPAAAAARRLMIRLADPGPTQDTLVRRRAPRCEVVAPGDDAAERALALLTERRLVSVTEDAVEVAHEALFAAWPRLRAWLDEDAAGRRLVRHLAGATADWLAADRDPAELYRGTRLQAGLDWVAVHRDDLTERERAFLDASASEADRERQESEERLLAERRGRRRLLRILTALGVVVVVALAAAALAVDSRRDAQRSAAAAQDARRIAEARRLGALGVVTQDLDRALLLAVQAVKIDNSAETRGDLLATLLRSPAAGSIVRPDGGHRPLALDMSPNGRSLVAGFNNGNLLLVDVGTRQIEVLDRPERTDETIQVAEFSADGRSIAVMHTWGNDESAVEVWDVQSRTVRRVPGTARTWGVGWSPSGRRLAVVRFEADALVIDLERPSGRPVALRGSAGQEIGPVRWAGPDSVVISPAGKPLGVWDAVTGLRRHSADVGEESATLGVSSSGRMVAVGRNTEVHLYETAGLRRRAVLTGHRARIMDLAFSPDGRTLATTGDDREVILWDVNRAQLAERLPGHAGRVIRATWSPDGRTLWTVSLDGTLMSWDVSGRRRLARRVVPKPTVGAEWFSVDGPGNRIVGGYQDGTARAWDVASGKPLSAPLRVGGEPLPTVGISPEGSLAVAGSWEGRALMFRAGDGKLLGPIPGLSGEPVLDVSFSPDGKIVAVSTRDGTVHLIDAASRRPTGPPIKAGAPVWLTVWSPDGRSVLLTTDSKNEVAVWSVPERRRLTALTPSTMPTLIGAYAPDGKLAVTGGTDGRLRFWDTTTWQQLGVPVLMGAGFLVSASFSPDGSHLITGSTDGTVRVLDVATRKPLGPPMPGADNTRAFARWVQGNRVVAGFQDGSITAYDVDPASWARRACAIAGRQLSEEEWADALPGRPYERTC